ncbi:DUF169 domain-containing protein [Spirochaetota bacterium]
MDNNDISKTLKDILNIKKEPIAMKAMKELPDNIDKFPEMSFPGICTQIGEVVEKGTNFYIDDEQCYCTGGNVAMGLSPDLSKDERDEMIEAHFSMSPGYKDVETAILYEENMHKMKPEVKEKNKAIQIGPLKDIEDPDIVLIFCTPKDADVLNRTFCYTTGNFAQGYGGNGGCPFLIQYPFITGKPSFSYSDVAWRKYIGLADEELTVSYPYKSLVEIIDNLPTVSEAYEKYGVYDE